MSVQPRRQPSADLFAASAAYAGAQRVLLSGGTEEQILDHIRAAAARHSDPPAMLAERAGVLAGYYRDDETLQRYLAKLLILAGADRDAVPQWIAVGRERMLDHADFMKDDYAALPLPTIEDILATPPYRVMPDRP